MVLKANSASLLTWASTRCPSRKVRAAAAPGKSFSRACSSDSSRSVRGVGSEQADTGPSYSPSPSSASVSNSPGVRGRGCQLDAPYSLSFVLFHTEGNEGRLNGSTAHGCTRPAAGGRGCRWRPAGRARRPAARRPRRAGNLKFTGLTHNLGQL